MTILATQKNRISYPVYNISVIKKFLKSLLFIFGHPNVLRGSNPEENHVSKTS